MNTKCAAFWKHTNVRSDNKIFPCCRFKNSIMEFTGDLDNILTSTQYERLRKMSDNNEYIDGCSKCYMEEEVGKKSLRQKFNEEYSTENVQLEFLEIGFDNICNLACDGCYPEFSSEWSKILYPDLDKKLHYKSIEEIKHIPDSITKILFLGGEPLMTNRHKKFLQIINNQDKVSVTYNTNGTFLLDNETVKLLKKFKETFFIISVDAFGDLNDKVRKGSNWNDILNFIKQCQNLDFPFSIHTTIHINNWLGLKDLSHFIRENNYDWTTNILTYPNGLSINNSENKEEIISFLKPLDIPNKESIIEGLVK